MKKILLALLLIATPCFAADQVRVQVRFQKLLFVCPDGYEVVNNEGTYEHTCADGSWTNNFVRHDGSISYSEKEYADIDEKTLNAEKDKRIEEQIYNLEHPPVVVEPTVADYQQMIESKMQEVEQMTEAVKTVATKAQLESIKASIDAKSVSVATSISEKSVIAEEIKK